MGVIWGLYRGYMGVIQGLYREHIGTMENIMETTIVYWGFPTSYSLNSFKGGYTGGYIGDYFRGY